MKMSIMRDVLSSVLAFAASVLVVDVDAFAPLQTNGFVGARRPRTPSAATSFRISAQNQNLQYEECTILEGTSPKAIKLRKQVQELWNNPESTSPIILWGPRGSGKGELAEEIVYRLPSWQTQQVHRLSC